MTDPFDLEYERRKKTANVELGAPTFDYILEDHDPDRLHEILNSHDDLTIHILFGSGSIIRKATQPTGLEVVIVTSFNETHHDAILSDYFQDPDLGFMAPDAWINYKLGIAFVTQIFRKGTPHEA